MYYFIYCKIKNDEINYFEYNNSFPLTYDILCGSKEKMNAIVNIIDKTKYPVFRVQYFVLPEGEYISYNSKFIILANIEGSISEIKEDYNLFLSLINIKRGNHSYIDYLSCSIEKPYFKQDTIIISLFFLF